MKRIILLFILLLGLVGCPSDNVLDDDANLSVDSGILDATWIDAGVGGKITISVKSTKEVLWICCDVLGFEGSKVVIGGNCARMKIANDGSFEFTECVE